MGIVPNAQTKSLNTFFIGVTLKQVLMVQFTTESTLVFLWIFVKI